MSSRRVVWGGVGALGALAGFVILSWVLRDATWVARADRFVAHAVIAMRTPVLTGMMVVLTGLGGWIVVSAATASIAGFELTHGNRTEALLTVVTVAGSAALVGILKDQFDRVRPAAESAMVTLPESYSYPSGHAMASFCLAAAIAFAVQRSGLAPGARWLTLVGCAVYVLIVGFSRVYLGVHFASDVVASWLLGGALISLAVSLGGLPPDED